MAQEAQGDPGQKERQISLQHVRTSVNTSQLYWNLRNNAVNYVLINTGHNTEKLR